MVPQWRLHLYASLSPTPDNKSFVDLLFWIGQLKSSGHPQSNWELPFGSYPKGKFLKLEGKEYALNWLDIMPQQMKAVVHAQYFITLEDARGKFSRFNLNPSNHDLILKVTLLARQHLMNNEFSSPFTQYNLDPQLTRLTRLLILLLLILLLLLPPRHHMQHILLVLLR